MMKLAIRTQILCGGAGSAGGSQIDHKKVFSVYSKKPKFAQITLLDGLHFFSPTVTAK